MDTREVSKLHCIFVLDFRLTWESDEQYELERMELYKCESHRQSTTTNIVPRVLIMASTKQCKEKRNRKRKEAYVDTPVSFTIQIAIASS